MLVRRNLASYIHGALLFWAEIIPTEAQIQAATIQDAKTFLSTTMEGEGFHATAEDVYATRTKEEEMVQELLKDWQKGAHGYIPEVKEDNVIQLGCENFNSLSIFHPTKSKMRKLNVKHYLIKKTHKSTSQASNGWGLHSGTRYKLQNGSKRHPPRGPLSGRVQQQGFCGSQHT
jgi:hypothetical protein